MISLRVDRKKGRGRKTYRYDKEHIHAGIDILESARVVREFITWVCVRGVPEENALYLAWVVCNHRGVISHDIAIARICN